VRPTLSRPVPAVARSGRWRPTRLDLSTAGLIAGVFLVTYVSTVRTKPLFAPDTRYYSAMALWFSGDSQHSAAQEVAAHSARSGWASPPVDQLFGWGLVQPRVVYPALSTPFVKLFGIDGMAIVPGVALALFIALLTVLLVLRWGHLVAVVTVLLICISPMLFFYFAAMLTESLTALWTAVLLALVWRHQRAPSPWLVLALVLVTTISGFTRQATLIPAGAFVAAWVIALVLRQDHLRWRAAALAVGATAIGVQVLQMVLFPGFSQADQFKMKTGADTLGEAVARSPRLAWDIVVVDVRRLAEGDRALLVLLTLALVSMVVFWKRSESHLLLGALAAYELYNVTNGTPTSFRYGTPGLAFVACSVAVLIAAATRRVDPTALDPTAPSDAHPPRRHVAALPASGVPRDRT
jgi:hypothetical protein